MLIKESGKTMYSQDEGVVIKAVLILKSVIILKPWLKVNSAGFVWNIHVGMFQIYISV